jgi:hypothetical protein
LHNGKHTLVFAALQQKVEQLCGTGEKYENAALRKVAVSNIASHVGRDGFDEPK